MESIRGLSDEELLEKLQSRRGPLGPPRKLYEKKFYEFETRRWRRGGADNPDNDRAPSEFGEGARAWQTIGERPSPTVREHTDSPLRLEPRQPLRAPPGPPWSPPGSSEIPPDHPGRLLPLRPQLLALGLIGGVLLGLLLLGGAPG